MTQAPVIVVVCAELGKAGFTGGGNVTGRDDWKVAITDKGDWYMFDAALAMQNLALAAHTLGLGTVFVGGFNPRDAAAALRIPRDVAVVAMTPLGYPDGKGKPSSRRSLSEVVFQDRYGES